MTASFQDLLSGPVNFASRAESAANAIARHVSQQPDACHNLSYVDGKAEMASVGKAWHNQGAVLTGQVSAAEMIRAAHLDWSVSARQVSLLNGVDHIEGYRAIVRDDTGLALSVVGDKYEPFQNAELFSFLDSVCSDGQAAFESAGALDQGRKVWALLRTPKDIQAAPGDTIKCYLGAFSTHDGTGAVKFRFTSVRVVCNNTYSAALSGQSGFTIRHTMNMRDKVSAAARILRGFDSQVSAFSADVQKLVNSEMDRPAAKAMFCALMNTNKDSPIKPISSIESAAEFGRLLAGRSILSSDVDRTYRDMRPGDREAVSDMLYALNDGKNTIGGIGGSAWSAVNSATDWIDHQRTARGETMADKNENRFASNLLGGAQADKEIVYAMATNYAAARSN